MNRQALLIIDMLNDYLHPEGKLFCAPCRQIIPSIAASARFARSKNIPVVYLNTCLENESEPLALKWGMHAVEGSKGARVIDELTPAEGDIIISKKSYNGFYNTELDEELRRLNITETVITGIHTHVCVLLTAVSAFERGFTVTVLQDCIAASTPESHNSRLRFFNTHVGRLICMNEWMGELSATMNKVI